MPTLHCQCHGRGAALSYKTTQRAQHRRQGTPNLSKEKNRIERQRTPFRSWPAILLHFHLSTRWLKHKALRQAPVGAAAVNAERGGLGTTAVADPPPQESLAGCPSRHHAKLSTPFGNNYVGRTWRRVMPRAITSLHRLGPFRPSRIFPPPSVSVVLLERQDKTRRRLQCPIPTSPSRTWVPSQGVASCEGPLARCRPSEPV